MSIELKESFISRIDFTNTPQIPGTKIALKHNYSYNVKYGKGDICRADLECHIKAEGLENLIHIDFIASGIFTFDTQLPKESVHRESYELLFPIASAFCQTLSVNAGMRPIRLIKMDISASDIYRFDLGSIRGSMNKEKNETNGEDTNT